MNRTTTALLGALGYAVVQAAGRVLRAEADRGQAARNAAIIAQAIANHPDVQAARERASEPFSGQAVTVRAGDLKRAAAPSWLAQASDDQPVHIPRRDDHATTSPPGEWRTVAQLRDVAGARPRGGRVRREAAGL